MRKRSALDGAEAKGAQAYDDGEPLTANPYGDQRTWYGGVTWARAFNTAWRDGYQKKEKENARTRRSNR